MTQTLSKMEMLEQLERIQYEPKVGEDTVELSQMSLADSLLLLAELDHEREYALCRAVAQHLLGQVPEPDDIELDEF